MRKAAVSAVVLAVAGWGCDSTSGVDSTQDVTIEFSARVGAQDFVCGQTYDNLGASGTSLQLSDFRFYVHAIALEDADGNDVPVTLDTNDWQSEGTALLDFEDGPGDYVGGQSSIGVESVSALTAETGNFAIGQEQIWVGPKGAGQWANGREAALWLYNGAFTDPVEAANQAQADLESGL